MKIAHLILAHSQPDLLKRLVERLTHPDADIYIHLDAKTPLQPFEAIKKLSNVYFIDYRVKVYWGSFNIVQATINGFQQIIRSGRQYGYVNLLSGQDYPLKSATEIHQYLSDNPGKAFMNALVAETHWMEALPRVELYHFNNIRFPGRFVLQGLVNKLMPKRKLPDGLILVGRSQWFTVTGDHIRYITEYWEQHPALQRFVKMTWAPDEFIFQTILYNSKYKADMVDEDLRYIDWSAGGASPKTLTMEDAEKLISSGKFYARKFDQMKDNTVMDRLDKAQNSAPSGGEV
ncbi:glycosyl transferase [Mucilaginibacter hurinus]|uniref:Peptide O-xylosyltransferase n=1 Tax=Mucilaginibacter hurinus TaxID=2201324 RepID=A0A367GNQ3_9SPHI|nr:beta-1,6-N-acetylglucosaminyltransferase [Mucilaginibacter hurinus]RCH55122.1 glycosyl transferase [Mucilaginibacter hurinus]